MDDHLERLAKLFLKFPGIGTRQAKRFAYFVLTQEPSYISTLSDMMKTARSLANTCTRCYRIFEGTQAICSICADPKRNQDKIAVIEKSQDIEAFNKTDYNGLFFVLGGLIPIVQKDVLAGTNVAALVERAQAEAQSLSEIILAFPVTPNGEHTDTIIREMLMAGQKSAAASSYTITSLGRGLSTGAELEYADAASLSASLKKRE